ncbi:hypothetical protein Pcinc_003335 [Petrolisthes cinctipes]|uniref:Uncharacterized protein n=1 Tax=Petrolisthes cinctipes TaxID=88211 RepID=A0AAE1GGW0_PETCI|nr:hypothetical protein Pcinc_003335 [Petrolisthes cinctipes]
MECFQRRHRSTAGITIFLPWIFGLILIGGVFKLFLNWFWSLFFISLSHLIFIPLLWFIDESPRWLIVRGHHDRALQVLKKAAR